MPRTHVKHVTFKMDNPAGTITDYTAYVNTVSPVGLTHEEADVMAWSDGVRNYVVGHPEAPLQIGGPFDSTFHADAIQLNGDPSPMSLDIQIGMEAAWQAGDPQFGISNDGTSGYIMSNYTVNLDDMTWSARVVPKGPLAPAWGTAAET